MPVETAISVLTSFVGVGLAILLAGVPWAYSVHGRLATIETSLRETLAAPARLSTLEHRLARLEFIMETQESK